MGFNPVAWISWPPSIVLGCTVRLLLFAGMPRFVHDATLSPSECISLINSLRVAGRKEYLAEPTLGCVPLLICAPRIPFPDKANRIERHARLDTLPPLPPPLPAEYSYANSCAGLPTNHLPSGLLDWMYTGGITARIGVRTIGIFRSTSLGLLEES